jgi:hypothetical protein
MFDPRRNAAFERVLQLAEALPVSQPSNEAINWEGAVHERIQLQRRLTPREVLHLSEGYQEGSTLEELASQYDIHRLTVMAQLERSGIARRGKGPTEEQASLAVELYQQGNSNSRIGSLLGFSGETIRRRLVEAGSPFEAPMIGTPVPKAGRRPDRPSRDRVPLTRRSRLTIAETRQRRSRGSVMHALLRAIIADMGAGGIEIESRAEVLRHGIRQNNTGQ